MDRDRQILLGLGAALLVALGFFVVGALAQEYEKRPNVRVRVEARDYGYLYNFYVSARPNMAGRPWYGNASAPVTVMAFTNFEGCEACDRFYETLFRELEAAYIGPGFVRFYQKSVLSREEYDARGVEYRYAAALACANRMKSDLYWDFFFELLNATPDGILSAAQAAGLDRGALEQCMGGDLPELREDMAETETFGIVSEPVLYVSLAGAHQKIFYGVPTTEQFRRQGLRPIELMVGR